MVQLHIPCVCSFAQLCPMQPARLLCPWDFPGNDTGVRYYFLLQRIFPTQRQNPRACIAGGFLTAEAPGNPRYSLTVLQY